MKTIEKFVFSIGAKISGIIALVMLMCLFPRVNSQEHEKDFTGSPYFIIQNEEGAQNFPLLSTFASVNIAGIIANVTVQQVYVNNSAQVIEAVYVFPASTRAAVHGMQFRLGEREIIAMVQEKEEARSNYQQARDDGKTAALLEQHRPNVFQMNVANILPGDTIKVTLTYAEQLNQEEGTYKFVYPTVTGPRYSGMGSKESIVDKWVSNPYTAEGVAPMYDFGLNLQLNAGLPLSKAACKTHQVKMQWENKSSLSLSLADSERKGGNRDFILEYALAADKIANGLLLFEGKSENFFLTMLQPPKRFTEDEIPAREYIFIVDVSGSMNGFPLDISKRLLRDLIGSLKPKDKFNVLLFAGTTASLSETSLPATKENIAKAIQVIEKQRGGGGTELLPAIKKAISSESEEAVSRSFIILTDGYVSVEKEAFDFIRSNLGKSNFFSFGIGTSVNRFLIEGMANVGKGEAFFVTEPAGATETVNAFRKYIQAPLLTNIHIAYEGFDAYDVEPAVVPDLFASRPVQLIGKYRGEAKGKIILKGLSGKGTYKTTLNIADFTSEKQNDALPYLWAREMIRLHHDYVANSFKDEELEKLVLQTGLKYNLLTAFTSFVAIDSEKRNTTGSVETIQQPLPLPQGVSNYALSAKYANVSMSGTRNKLSYTMSEAESLADVDIKEEKNDIVIKPVFIGGWDAFDHFVETNVSLPEKFAGGNIFARITIDAGGQVVDIELIRGINGNINKEVIRVLRLSSGKWEPGSINGENTEMDLVLTVKL